MKIDYCYPTYDMVKRCIFIKRTEGKWYKNLNYYTQTTWDLFH